MTGGSPLGFYVVDNRSDGILYFNDRLCHIWSLQHYPRQELAPGCCFLRKPFTPDELIREVRAILDSIS